MKILISYIVSWTCFWFGHWTSLCMHTPYTWWLYPMYNTLMYWSITAQDWGDCKGPWQDSK